MAEGNFWKNKAPQVCIVGAGFSGLTAAIQLKRQLKLTSFKIYEENHGIGGTWLLNNYPGIACGIPSHYYSWSFELNPDWPEVFSAGSEILAYMEKAASKYELYPHIVLNAVVKSTVWDSGSNGWNVTVFHKETNIEQIIHFDFVITGTGALRIPNIPEEFKNFKNTLLHSANWDNTIHLDGKVVGVVGSGFTATQIIPALAPIVSELHCYQRNPSHVGKRPQQKYSSMWKAAFKYFPPLMWIIRVALFLIGELFHLSLFENTTAHHIATKFFEGHMKDQVKDPSLLLKISPSFPFGCKRILLHSGYYPALQLPHVTVHREEIEVHADSIACADGSVSKLDILILATGFKTNCYLEPMKIIGRKGVVVSEVWKHNKPSSYLGIMTRHAPNQFILLGPNTFWGHNSTIFIIECQVNYVIQILRKIMSDDIKALYPKKILEEKYMVEIEQQLKKTVWSTGNCGNWYTNARGNITVLWPYNCFTYWNRTRKFNIRDYKLL